jgi:polyhydroxybutyrate depolymerase
MKTWNDGRNVSAAALAGVDDVGFVSKLIGVLSAQYNIDPNRVYATGLSNGGFFTGLLACQLANRVVAVAIVAATMDPRVSAACNPARALSIMMVQGDSDPLVPFNGGFVKGAL